MAWLWCKTYKPVNMLLFLSRFFFALLMLSALLLVNCKSNSPGQTPSTNSTNTEIKDSVLVSGLQFPWEILWGPDNFIWMTERGGKISRVNPATGAVISLLTIPDVVSTGEGGLLGMALHPDFSTTPSVFIGYNYNNAGNYREKIVRNRKTH